MVQEKQFVIGGEDEKIRVDAFLAQRINTLSRSFLQKGIKEGWVKVNGNIIKSNYRLLRGDTVWVKPPRSLEQTPLAENLPIDIIYEDDDIIVVNKPRGMVVYPAAGNLSGTLVNALLFHTDTLSRKNGTIRPGIVHRLDKDTSGVMIVAKNDEAHNNITHQFKCRQVEKTYLALVKGSLKGQKGTINAPIGRHPSMRRKMAVTNVNSKNAITHFSVIASLSEFTFLKIQIETGRTHQIRVHMKYIGHPIAGDKIYSKGKLPFYIEGQALHALKLGITHPRYGSYMEFVAPLPKDLLSALKFLRQREGED